MNFTYCPSCGSKHAVEQVSNTEYHYRQCNWRYWNNPKTAIAALFLKPNGTFLAGKRGREPKKGLYDLPGGFLDYKALSFINSKQFAVHYSGLADKLAEHHRTQPAVANPTANSYNKTNAIIF
jgi:hypothetical protein